MEMRCGSETGKIQTKKRCFRMMWVMLILILPCIFACLTVARADDFSGCKLDDRWTYRQSSDSFLMPLYEFDQQQREENRGTKLLREPNNENWTIETLVSSDTYEGDKNLQSGLCIYADARNYLFFGFAGSTTVLYGMYDGQELVGAKNAGSGRFLRAEKQNAAYSFYWSNDGTNWTAFSKGFTDQRNLLTGAKIGLMNRALCQPDIFHSASMMLKCWAAEYAYFYENGKNIPLPTQAGEGWTYDKSWGVFAMVVPSGARTTLLMPQKEEDWALDARIGYIAGAQDALTGMTLYQDENNYLVLGVRGLLNEKTTYEVSGVINGRATGSLMTYTSLNGADNRSLRILRRSEAEMPDRYYFYLAENGNEYAFKCLGVYEDGDGIFRGGKYGLIGIEQSGEQCLTAQFEYCTETSPDAYTDYFISKTMDAQWTEYGAVKLNAGNSRVTFASEEDESAFLLRAPLQKDWRIDCSLITVRENNFAGLAVCEMDAFLQFGVRGGKLVMRVKDGETITETIGGQASLNLRIIRENDAYVMQASDDGLFWRDAFVWQDEQKILANARYGLTVIGDNCGFRWFCESLRPSGIMEAVEGIDILFPLTGENGINKTQSAWGFGSGDLGSLFEHNGKIYMVFGDTFSGDRISGSWIHNALSVGTTDDPEKGICFSKVCIGKHGEGLVVSDASYPCAMIPSCGFGQGEGTDETLYMWIHEIYSWQTGGHRDISGMGWAYSTDGGENWTYQRMFDGNSSFQFVSCYEENGMLYLYGNIGGGYGETYLMCVKKEDALDVSAYRYYAGLDTAGTPVWANSEAQAVRVLDYNEREIGVTYNEYLDRYLMTGWDSFNGLMVIHEAPTLFGPWSEATLLLPRQYTPTEKKEDKMTWIYGAYSLPNMTKMGGKSMFFTLSEYDPYQVYWMRVDFKKKGE